MLEPVGSEGELGAQADALLAQTELLRNAEGLPDVAALRQRVRRTRTDARARLQLGTVLAGRGEFEPALEALLAAAELDPKLATGPAREEMVKVFYALGSNHPLPNDYRSRLARLLY
ncbi:MAG: tetratricopeptide repeat protein [Gemmataceae bacterium]